MGHVLSQIGLPLLSLSLWALYLCAGAYSSLKHFSSSRENWLHHVLFVCGDKCKQAFNTGIQLLTICDSLGHLFIFLFFVT